MADDLIKAEVELREISDLGSISKPALAVTSQPAATNWSVEKYNTFLE